MTKRQMDPKKQFSKKMASRTEWYWFVFMILLVAAIVLTPDAALPAVYLGIMVTGVMIVSVLAYTKNSIDEKWFFWANEIAKSIKGTNQSEKEPEEDSSEGGESNG